MSKHDKGNQRRNAEGALDKFELGGALGPIEDQNEYEHRLNGLPPDQNQMAKENTRLADLCQYFSQQQIKIFHPKSWNELQDFRDCQRQSAFEPSSTSTERSWST